MIATCFHKSKQQHTTAIFAGDFMGIPRGCTEWPTDWSWDFSVKIFVGFTMLDSQSLLTYYNIIYIMYINVLYIIVVHSSSCTQIYLINESNYTKSTYIWYTQAYLQYIYICLHIYIYICINITYGHRNHPKIPNMCRRRRWHRGSRWRAHPRHHRGAGLRGPGLTGAAGGDRGTQTRHPVAGGTGFPGGDRGKMRR